jgi:cytochrome c biogenesis protein CcdA/thiol-disulfide isomerase/thioredoxin
VALLIGVAFVAGVITALSPCVLPVLPIVFAGGATGGRRRPYALVAGLVASFTAFTLAATALLSALGLPDDLLRNIAIAVVLLVGLSLFWPWLGRLVERPFLALGRRRPGELGGGFFLGVSLGLLFTPCAGPVIAAVATLAATESFSVEGVLVTLAYALGAGVVLLGLALAAHRGVQARALRARAPRVRQALGGLMAVAGVLMILGLDLELATKVPGYTRALQGIEESAAAGRELDRLVAGENRLLEESELRDFGVAPDFAGIQLWLNSEPLTLRDLRGKVVLLDFWTYSCINCLRTLPFIKRWDAAYRSKGLVIVGVHTPEFAFEREPDNVRGAVGSLGVRYPVALDNDYATWNAWGNRYWPAKYFVDRRGHVRYAHFGEGEYEESEQVIRTLLAEPGLPQPVAGAIPDETPTEPQTPETYLGHGRIDRYVGSELVPDREASYTIPPAIPVSTFAYGGRWRVEEERIVAGRDARLRLAFHAHDVFLVLGASAGPERVEVRLDGRPTRTIRVNEDRLYTLARIPGPGADHTLELRFSPGTEAYAFTFG